MRGAEDVAAAAECAAIAMGDGPHLVGCGAGQDLLHVDASMKRQPVSELAFRLSGSMLGRTGWIGIENVHTEPDQFGDEAVNPAPQLW